MTLEEKRHLIKTKGITKGFWLGHYYHKKSPFSFHTYVETTITDEILWRMYRYQSNLQLACKKSNVNDAMRAELESVAKFLIDNQKHTIIYK